MSKQYIVNVTYDPEYKLYQARCADVPGMFVDCDSLQEAIEVVMDVLPEMVEEQEGLLGQVPLFHVDPKGLDRVH